MTLVKYNGEMPVLILKQVKRVFGDLPPASALGRNGVPAAKPVNASAVRLPPPGFERGTDCNKVLIQNPVKSPAGGNQT